VGSYKSTNKEGRDEVDMKFLVVATMREIPPVPTEQFLEMTVGEWQTVLQFRKEGKAEVNYGLAGLKGGMGIVEVESGAELNAMLMRLPFYPFLDVQIYPLMTVNEALSQAKQGLEAFKAQK